MSTWANKLSNLNPFGYFNSSQQENYDLVHFKNDEKISKDAIEYSKIAHKNNTNSYHSDKDSYVNSTINFNNLPSTHINNSSYANAEKNMTINFTNVKVDKSQISRD
jgi:hypothetical protein